MRILGFSKKWTKLYKPDIQATFTTFRVKRRDKRDWSMGETVRVVYHPRQPDHEILGVAKIVDKQASIITLITDEEAVEDGFPCGPAMLSWLRCKHRSPDGDVPNLNKLTLQWIERLTI